jgi:hypothetical protein
MKKGKTSTLKGFKNIKSSYGTVDSIEMKSIYIVIQTWMEPKEEYDNWNRITRNLERNVRLMLSEVLDKEIFEDNMIVDLDLRTSGIQPGKRSFMNLEVTLFFKKNMEFKSVTLRDKIKDIVKSIYQYTLMKNKYFTLHKTKKEKV